VAGSNELLMARVQQGDRDAFRTLYAEWRAPLFHFLLRRTGSRELAEECYQDTWARVWKSAHTYDPRRAFKSWLFTIAANVGHDAKRPVVADFRLETTTNSDRVEAKNTLVVALHMLEGRDRAMMLLSIEGFKPAEIAEAFGVSPNSVRVRLSRARSQLREQLLAR